MLQLSVVEARALKNKLYVNSLAEIVSFVRDYIVSDQENSLVEIIHECLVSRQKTIRFINLIK